MLGAPARIMQFYSQPPYYNAPQWFYDPPDVACGPGGSAGGGDASSRMAPSARFDCVLGLGGGGPSESGGGGGGGAMVITESVCHYTAYYDSAGNYLYAELEYCEEYSWVEY